MSEKLPPAPRIVAAVGIATTSRKGQAVEAAMRDALEEIQREIAALWARRDLSPDETAHLEAISAPEYQRARMQEARRATKAQLMASRATAEAAMTLSGEAIEQHNRALAIADMAASFAMASREEPKKPPLRQPPPMILKLLELVAGGQSFSTVAAAYNAVCKTGGSIQGESAFRTKGLIPLRPGRQNVVGAGADAC
jgi:hypothetical protein